MEWQLNTESVIARLMGLDQLRHRQRVWGNRSVLSEGYIRKAASVGARRGSLVSIRRSCGSKNEKVDTLNDSSRIEALEGKSNSDCFECESSNASTGLGISKNRCEDKRSVGERDGCCTQGNGLRYVEKPEGGRGVDYANKTSKLGSEMVMKAAGVEPKLEKVMCGFKDGVSDGHSELGYRERNDSLWPERGNHHHVLMWGKVVVDDTTSLQCSCIGCAENKNKVCQKVRRSSKFSELSIPVANVDMETGHASPVSPSQASPKKQIFERWTTRIKVVRRIDFSEKSTSQKMIPLSDKESTFGKGKDSLTNGWNLKQHHPTPEYKSPVDISELKGGTNCDQFQTSNEKNNDSENSVLGETELSRKNSMPSIGNLASQSEVTSYTSAGGGHSSYIPRDFIAEAMGNEFCEELADSNSSRIGTPEFQENLKGANQKSPDSVLKIFDGECYSNEQCFDSIGFQLQVLNLDNGDYCSEESVMGVSVDDDSMEQIVDPSPGGKKVRRWLGDTESRNFSYMVDVLDEAGLSGTNPCMDSKTWHSLESSISPLVFEALEKKYGKQTSWEKSDRRLLFDSINSSLLTILDPGMNFSLSIKRLLRANMRRDEIEDELWAMLISQETEKSNTSSEKVLEQWIETNEGMSIIYTELASSLFDELVEELVGLLIC